MELIRFETAVIGAEEFGATARGIERKSHILIQDNHELEIAFRGYTLPGCIKPPPILVELHVDGILRDVVKPYTGRGLEHSQFAEATMNRGMIITNKGQAIMKKFRFAELDIDDGKLLSHLLRKLT